MNITTFTSRLQECRRRKYTSQQAFADAYMERFGMIRSGKKGAENNMFGTVQSWEQGKSTPTAEVLANICDLLECDADYLLGRIPQRTHDITNAHRYTGLSPEALEQLHEYKMNLITEPDWAETRELEEKWTKHRYYQAFALYIIDELLTGSATHKFSASKFERLLTMIYEEGIGVKKEDYDDPKDSEELYKTTDEEKEFLAAQTREEIDMIIYLITNNIRDILYENAANEKLPLALNVATSAENKNCYFFSVKE